MTFTAAFIVAALIGGERGAGFAAAIAGILIGNQIGCILDDFAKMNRVLGGLVLTWNLYNFVTGPPNLEGMPYVKMAFFWGFAFSCIGAVQELAIFRVYKKV